MINCNAGSDWCALVTSYTRIVRRKLIGCNIAAVTGGVTEVTHGSVLDKYDTVSDEATSTRYCIDELIDIYIENNK